MHRKLFAIVVLLLIGVTAGCDLVLAGALKVGGEAYTGYGPLQDKGEASITRLHGGSFKVEARPVPSSKVEVLGDSEVFVDDGSSKLKFSGLFSYDFGHWKLYLSDDYTWKLEEKRPEKDSLSRALKASIVGEFLDGVRTTLTWKGTRENPLNGDGARGVANEISLASSWKPAKDIFAKAKVIHKSGNYEEESWRNYREKGAGAEVKVPLGENVTATLKGEVLQKTFPDGTRYSPYDKRSLGSKVKWDIKDGLSLTVSGEVVERVVWNRATSDYLKKTLKAELDKKYGKNITMKLHASAVRKDFPNAGWGSSDYGQRFFGMTVKNRLLVDLTFTCDLKYSEKWYLKRDQPLEKRTSLGLEFEKTLSDKTALDLGIDMLKKSVKDELTSDAIFKAKLSHELSDDLESVIMGSYSNGDKKGEIKAEIKYSFK